LNNVENGFIKFNGYIAVYIVRENGKKICDNELPDRGNEKYLVRTRYTSATHEGRDGNDTLYVVIM